MLSQSWLRLGVSLLIGAAAVCALVAWGQSAAANESAVPVPRSIPSAIESPSPLPARVEVDAPWEVLAAHRTTTPTLNLGLHNALVSGFTPRPEPIELVLLRDDLIVASAMANPVPDGSGGYLYAAKLYRHYGFTGIGGGGGGYCCLVQSGDRLQAAQAGAVVSLTVPLLTALADQSIATVYGQAPPTATVDGYLYHFADPTISFQETVTASPTGSYTLEFGFQTTMTARDYGFVFYADAASNQVYRRFNAPYLQVGLGSRYVDGLVAPCTPITLSLYDDKGLLQTQPYYSGDSDGDFHLDLGHAGPTPDVGQRVVVTAAGQVISLTIPLLMALPDPVADQVTGQAPPGTPVQVDLYEGPERMGYHEGPPGGQPDARVIVTAATVGGIYTATFNDIMAGDYGAVYVTNLAGHRTYRRFGVPFLRACLGDYYLDGQVNESGPFTVTVIGQSGLVRDIHTVYAYEGGRFYDDGEWWRSELRLSAGDRVSVVTRAGAVLAMTMPTLTAQADQRSETVYGQAPPLSPLRVGYSPVDDPHYPPSPTPYPPPTPYPLLSPPEEAGLPSVDSPDLKAGGGRPYSDYDHEYVLTLTSTASGVYTADMSVLVTMTAGDQGAVFYVNPVGYEVVREYVVPPMPYVRAQVGGGQVSGVTGATGEVRVTLRDAAGHVKATATDYIYPWDSFSFLVHFYSAVIEAGDTIEVATDEKIIAVKVPPLSTVADWETDTISGLAPLYASLYVTCYGDGCGWQTWTITATSAGTYSLGLGGQVDIARGDRLEVTYTDPAGNQLWAMQRIAQLRAALYGHQVYIGGPAYGPFTFTLRAPDGMPLYTTTGTLGYNGETSIYLADPISWTPIRLEPSQTITANVTGDQLELSLPLLIAQADVTADVVSGLAPPGAVLQISVGWQTSYVTATSAGTYSLDLSDVLDIAPGALGDVIYRDEEGNRVSVEFGGPYLDVTLGASYVSGIAPSGAPVTVTLYDSSGVFKGSGRDDWFYGYAARFSVWLDDGHGNPTPVEGGDWLVVRSPGGEMSFAVPLLSATFDRETQVLSGLAPANVWLEVYLAGAHRRIQAGAGGTYAMDWADLAPQPGNSGTVHHVDERGNQTTVPFEIPYNQIYLPVILRERGAMVILTR